MNTIQKSSNKLQLLVSKGVAFSTSTHSLQKGKLSLQKLKDKALIDEQIEQVNLVFPDQYGRLTGLNLNSEYFLE